MTTTMQINKEEVINLYNNASQETKQTLEHIFGKKFLIPNVTERLKDWVDVYNELSEKGQYKIPHGRILTNREKLELIIMALNEGWKPEFTSDERRYYVVASNNIENPSYQVIEERNPLTDKPKELALKSYELARHIDHYFHRIVYKAFKR